MIEIKEINNSAEYQPLLINPATPFTQAWFYGEWQVALGRKVKRLLISQDGILIGCAQFVSYPLALKYKYWYAPFGPVLNQPATKEIISALKKYFRAGETESVFVRFDFTPSEKTADLTTAPKATYHGAYFQPRTEWVLDLAPSSEILLRNMAKNCRYEIKLAERRGVEIEVTTALHSYFPQFYELMLITAKRNKFSLHPRSYYEKIFSTPNNESQLFLVIARHEEQILAMNLILGYGHEAYYLFAASSNDSRELKPSYLAQWTSISEAKRRGFKTYNFGGVTEGNSDPTWAGLTAFKKKFGGQIKQHSIFYDFVQKPIWYYIYCLRKQVKQFSWQKNRASSSL